VIVSRRLAKIAPRCRNWAEMRLAADHDGDLRIYQHLAHVPIKNGFTG
jgi:hypothetical protein